MVWLPDDVWEAQQKAKQPNGGGKGSGGGGGKGKGKDSWMNLWMPMFMKGFFGKGKGKGRGKGLKGFPPEKKVWIGGISEGTTWKELQEHMNQAGTTKWAEVFGNKGIAAVAYATAEEATNAIATLNGSVLKGAPIECDVWQKKEKAPEATA